MTLALGGLGEISEVMIRGALIKIGRGGGDFDIQFSVSVGR